MPVAASPFLPPELLERIHARAPGYDRDNAFCFEDVAELAASGHLGSLVPTRFGGGGASLLDAVHAQASLARAAPATALAVGMHLIWTGVARTMSAAGDDSLDFVLRDAVAGEIFAFAISEPGNDLVLFGSTTDAAPQPDGGYAFTGTKIFTSLSPVWTRLGTFGIDTTSADAPKLVHAVLSRDAPGISIDEDWDTVGMRASQSHTTHLDDAAAAADRVFRRIDPGPVSDPLTFAIFANFEILVSAVYAGIGDRALELAVGSARGRTSSRTGSTKDTDPDVRRRIADAAIAMDALWPHLERLAGDLDSGVDHGDQWFRKLVGLKLTATATARRVVDEAIAVAGGAGYRSSAELGRLYRDVLASRFHPSDDDSARSTVARSLLGPAEV